MSRRGPGLRSIALLAVMPLALACGASTTAPSVQPSPTVSGQPSTSAPVGSSAASPAASVDPGAAAVRAFVKFASNPRSSYQGTFTGADRHTTDTLKITKGVLQVAGSDVLVRVTFTYPNGDHYVVEHRQVRGKAWIRFASLPWTRLASFEAADSMAAFPAVRGPADVTYLGPKTVAGKTLYQVEVKSAIVNPVMIPASNLTDMAVTSPNLIVLVDAKGQPVRGTAEITGRGRVSGQLQEIVIDLDITFTKVGQPVTIAAP